MTALNYTNYNESGKSSDSKLCCSEIMKVKKWQQLIMFTSMKVGK